MISNGGTPTGTVERTQQVKPSGKIDARGRDEAAGLLSDPLVDSGHLAGTQENTSMKQFTKIVVKSY